MQGFRLLFYGDSITEYWMGTNRCVPAVFQKHFGRYRPGVMAVSADQTRHLLWRLQHGEAPVKHPPQTVVLLIGTNDLGLAANAGAPGGRARVAVLEVLYFMRSRWPNAHIILLALLPRGCEKFFGCEPAESGPGSQGRDFSYPSIFTPSITKVNVLLE
ncbi:hypothetical protein CHLNCDRAFT_144244 [Chlorella variabilis]|uniref:SGNH hydrolase-type esterase domain-containing protein n=1 Tax=Chlorella variabilis TaxID=554065 RepID=E1ZC90_CHLVA|nr:hypothetical protein CHLNCDRAFT_144244 [Chlorella variabilis]EFN56767.1 hypothetical protein CHLNCDRAFT_144244 [Chlorella variabilis]|eukprot:XP_005848869.1 hypothetical protein CHLNCDRAFT_144244 [Chlorella variabilis]